MRWVFVWISFDNFTHSFSGSLPKQQSGADSDIFCLSLKLQYNLGFFIGFDGILQKEIIAMLAGDDLYKLMFNVKSRY